MDFSKIKKRLNIKNDPGNLAYQMAKHLYGDTPVPSEFEQGGGGIIPIDSPIDYLAAGIGSSIPKTLPKYLESEVGAIGRNIELAPEKNFWEKAKEKATEKGITTDRATKEQMERQKQEVQELLRKRREEQYQEYLKKIKGEK